jgi:peptidoglycan/xylan/chitin deacetylase (PgdA/CDA1 family)
MPRPLVRREIEAGYHAIISATGQAPRFFRSPVGMNNLSVHPVAGSLGLRVAGWSVEGCDGCPAAPTSVEPDTACDPPGRDCTVHEDG